jgi:hypothetical protein
MNRIPTNYRAREPIAALGGLWPFMLQGISSNKHGRSLCPDEGQSSRQQKLRERPVESRNVSIRLRSSRPSLREALVIVQSNSR